MNKNMGSADRKIRLVVIAPVLVVAGVLVGPGGWLAIVAFALAIVMAATSVVGTCPLYSLLGLRTCPLQRDTTPAREHPVSR